MTDALQSSLHTLAASQAFLKLLAVFLANDLLFAMALVLAGVAWVNRARVTWQYIARVVVSLGMAGVVTLIMHHFIHDPRPFVVEHYAPLAHASSDNGFPSDHTLMAALATGWAFWLNRRAGFIMVAGTILVMAGRLAIGAHHTLDVIGSVVFAGIGLLAAQFVDLGSKAQQPILPSERKELVVPPPVL